ncbi:hypothetical protein F4778DRAFT_775865 [Xylariomycetidae sp. FL2044]|nr:hypothetical protein F4778DRAFT_775865 [Xylariomycetidae sp. FL2044]
MHNADSEQVHYTDHNVRSSSKQPVTFLRESRKAICQIWSWARVRIYHEEGAQLRTSDEDLWKKIEDLAGHGIDQKKEVNEKFTVVFHIVHNNKEDLSRIKHRNLSIQGKGTIIARLAAQAKIKRDFPAEDETPEATKKRENIEAIMDTVDHTTHHGGLTDTYLEDEDIDSLPNPVMDPRGYSKRSNEQSERHRSKATQQFETQKRQQTFDRSAEYFEKKRAARREGDQN